ncbi:MAG: 23S rRNA (adenine(2503)-C(2))-methyltransferase RlmN [Bacteroidales bacterium]|nr:23S rRNA (adenine(2503)-C(2))-methyltransferase RlmN [Bacteroidales bacterium]
MKDFLLGKTLTELKEIASKLNMPSFAAKQIAQWLYQKKVTSIDQMTNLSKSQRSLLEEKFEIGASQPSSTAKSVDGTIKYLFKTDTNKFVEAVYIPDNDRATLCVSSQMGCKMNCLFCMTGKQGFNGNLTSNEIINQIQSIPENDKLTNLVFMGMGEPMDNSEQLFKTLEILTSDWGYGWSPKRITVSTIGLLSNLERFLNENHCHLAVSLHSPFPEERLSIMPVEKAWPMYDVIKLLKKYDFTRQRRLSFEYIMFNGFNDSLRHAAELVKLLKGMSCRVNLIRFHAIPNVELKTSDENSMIEFRDYLTSHGITCTIRSSRGEDIFAACGMLSTLEQKKKQQDNSPEI